MRDILILSIVGLGGILALRRPWLGVLLWTWISIMNPHRYSWGLAYSAPVAAVAAGSTILGLLFTKDRQSPFQGAPVWWLAAFAVWITISWLMGLDPAGDYAQWDKVMKIFLMTFVALCLIKSKQQIMAFAWVTVGSIAAIATKGGLFTILTGGKYHVWGPPDSFIADNNEFALATVVAIPMLHFLQLQLRVKWMRYVITAVIVLSVASALGSQSRGGLLALAAMGAVFWLRSRRKVLVGSLVLVAALMLLPMMPQHWWDRMHTIDDYTQDGSAMGRINAWHVAWHTATHYFFGAGMKDRYQFLFDQYGTYDHVARAAHSIYFEVLGNHGFVGLFIYLMLGVAAFRSAGWLRTTAKEIPEAKWAEDLGAMIQVSYIGFAVGGAFLSLSYFDLPYDLMVMTVLARKWVERRGWESDPSMSFAEAVGLKARGGQGVRIGNAFSHSKAPDLKGVGGIRSGASRLRVRR